VGRGKADFNRHPTLGGNLVSHPGGALKALGGEVKPARGGGKVISDECPPASESIQDQPPVCLQVAAERCGR